MSDEILTPERAVRLLRAKAAQLENMVQSGFTIREDDLALDIALVAGLLADDIQRGEDRFNLLLKMLEKTTSAMEELSSLVAKMT